MGVNGIYGLSGSGLDIESMVKVGMMSRQNEYDKMMQKYTQNEWKKTAYLDLNNQITTFNMSTLSDYKMSASMNSRTAESSNTNAVKVTANANAMIMSHRVDVAALSTNAHLISTAKEIKGEDTNGKSSIKLKDILGGALDNDPSKKLTFKIGDSENATDAKEISLDIDDKTTLNTLVSEINGLGLNIRATYDSINDKFSLYNIKASGEDGIYLDVSGDSNAEKFFNSLQLYQSKDGKLVSPENGMTDAEANSILQKLRKADNTENYTETEIEELSKSYGVQFYRDDNQNLQINIAWNSESQTILNKGEENEKSLDLGQKFIVGTYGKIIIDGNLYDKVVDNKHTADGVTYTMLNTTGSYAENKITEPRLDDEGNQFYERVAEGDPDIYEYTNNEYGYWYYHEKTEDGVDLYLRYEDEQLEEAKDENDNQIFRPVFDENGNPVYREIKKPVADYTNPVPDFNRQLYVPKIDEYGFPEYDEDGIPKFIEATDKNASEQMFYLETEFGSNIYKKATADEIGTPVLWGNNWYAQMTIHDPAFDAKEYASDENSKFAYYPGEGVTTTYEQVFEPLYMQPIYDNFYKPATREISNEPEFVSTGAVTVSVSQNVDGIVDKVKSFVESYNSILGALYEKYDEKPDSNYKPLTQSQKDAMKDDQVDKWEEKAKQGMLYHDQTLGKIINDMRNAISTPIEGINSKYNSIFSLGISTTGIKGQLVLDEEKLRKALAEDSDSVYNVFAKLDTEADKGKSGIIAENGVAQRLGDVFTNATKLIRTRAGSSSDIAEDSDLNSLLRELQTKMSNFKKLMSAFEDRLYKKYDAMEAALARLGMQLNFITGGQ